MYLNTPGEQDGAFALDVDGERAIYREDVFYREDLTVDKEDGKHGKTTHVPTKTSTKKHVEPSSSTGDGGLLGPLLGGILGIGRPRQRSLEEEGIDDLHNPEPTSTQDTDEDHESSELIDTVLPRPAPSYPEPTTTGTTPDDDEAFGIESVKAKEVGFAGIFFR